MKIPILRLKNILLASIQTDMSDEDILIFQRDILDRLKETECRGILIDITAMEIVDSFISRVIDETARMAHMLGAEVVLCGIQPDIALTLTEMGRPLIGVETALNLEQGYEKLKHLIEKG